MDWGDKMIINILVGFICLGLMNIYLYEGLTMKKLIKNKRIAFINLISVLFIIALGYFYQSKGTFIGFLVLFIILLSSAVVDYKSLEIPNELIVLGLGLGCLIIWINPMVTLKQGILGFFAFGIGMSLLSFLTKENIGYGDAKLMAVVGLLLGWQLALVLLVIAFALSALTGLFLLTFRLRGRKEMVPFAPFILIAFMVLVMI